MQPVCAQDRRLPPPGGGPAASKHVALAIGNDAYRGAPLRNAANDARAIQRRLSELGWDASLVVDGTKQSMERAVEAFVAKVGPGDEAVIFYAGHGVQVEGVNYLIPVDFEARDEADAKYRGVSAEWIHEKLTKAEIKTLQEELQKQGSLLSPSALDAKRQELARKTSARQTLLETGQADLERMQARGQQRAQELQSEFQARITPLLRDLARRSGAALVLDAQVVLSISASLDLSPGLVALADGGQAAGAVSSSGAPVVAVIDMQRLASESELGKGYAARFAALEKEIDIARAAKQAELNRRDAEVKALEEELDKQGSVQSAETRDRKRQEVTRKQRERQAFIEDGQAELNGMRDRAQQRARELQAEFQVKVKPVITSVAQARGVALLLDATSVLKVSGDELDLTGSVLAALDAKPGSSARITRPAVIAVVDAERVTSGSRLGRSYAERLEGLKRESEAAAPPRRAELQKQSETLSAELQARIRPFLESSARARGIDLVVQSSVALAVEPGIDLTPVVITALDGSDAHAPQR